MVVKTSPSVMWLEPYIPRRLEKADCPCGLGGWTSSWRIQSNLEALQANPFPNLNKKPIEVTKNLGTKISHRLRFSAATESIGPKRAPTM